MKWLCCLLLLAGPSLAEDTNAPSAKHKKKKHKAKHPRSPEPEAAEVPIPEDVPLVDPPTPEVTATRPAPAPVIEPAAPPAAAGRSSSGPPNTVVAASEPEPPHSPVAPRFDVAVGGGVLHRSFSYTDDIFRALDSYQLPAAASVEANGEVFPGAFAGPGWLGNLGLAGRYAMQPGLISVDAAGDKLATVSDAWELGPKLRFPLGAVEAFASVTYARQRFSILVPPGDLSAPVIPGVTYASVRADVGVRFAFSERFALLADAAYLDVLSSGAIGSAGYFPRLGVGGVEGRLGAAVGIGGAFEARAWADYRRYFFTMNPQPGDPYVVGGALDQYWTFIVAIAARG